MIIVFSDIDDAKTFFTIFLTNNRPIFVHMRSGNKFAKTGNLSYNQHMLFLFFPITIATSRIVFGHDPELKNKPISFINY